MEEEGKPLKNKSPGKTHFTAILMVFLALTGLFWTATKWAIQRNVALFNSVPPDKKFMLAWEDDLRRLERAKFLHPGFKDLKSVEFIATSDKIKTMLKKYPMKFKTNPAGHFKLEILLDELHQGGLMMQYDLVELKSGNTIWEQGRTFPQHLSK